MLNDPRRQSDSLSYDDSSTEFSQDADWSEIYNNECSEAPPVINPETSVAETNQHWYLGLPSSELRTTDGHSPSQIEIRSALEPFIRGGILPSYLVSNPERAAQTLTTMRGEINEHQHPAIPTLKGAMEEHRLLMYGESHLPGSPHRQLLIESIPKLKDAGATHLALEMGQECQPILDEFMKTGQIDLKTLPGAWKKPETLSILNAARDAGLILVAADMTTKEQHITDAHGQKILNPARDQHIASTIAGILDADPNNKVVYFGGARHNATGEVPEGEAERAGSILKKRYPGDVVTVACEIGGTAQLLGYLITDRDADGKLDQSVKGTRTPVAIKMSEAPSIAEAYLYEPGFQAGDTRSLQYKDYADILILHPGRYSPPELPATSKILK